MSDGPLLLGIDPGLRVMGYGLIRVQGRDLVLVEGGVSRTTSDAPLPQRLVELHRDMAELLQTYRPQAAAMESLWSAYKHPRTAILMGHARGVAMLALGTAGIPVTELAPARVKKSLTGNGQAGKPQVARAVKDRLRVAELAVAADVTDALALAITLAESLHRIGS